jgi:hypothetical protein
MKSITPQLVRSSTLGLLVAVLLLGANRMLAQCDKLAQRCEDNLVEFISDGQYYRASVKDAGEATIKITLYEGFRYRIVVCNDRPGAKVRYRVLDGSKAEVFESMGAKDGDYWDFELDGTDNFVIKASIPNNVGMGCILFSVGYDDEMMVDDEDFEEEDDPFFEDELDYDLDEEEENQ